MTVVVVGNCQANSMFSCLKTMMPEWDVIHFNISSAPADELRAALLSADIIITQPIGTEGRGAWIQESKASVFKYPRITFPAFFPDFSHITNGSRKVLQPLGGPHSSIVFHGWRSGLTPQKTLDLFNAETFSKLGYFNLFAASIKAAEIEGARCGVDLPNLIRKWMERGNFMHTMNHARIFAVADLARDLCKRIGVVPTVEFPEDYIADPAGTGPGWPVYPEIAEKYGFRGSRLFRVPEMPAKGTSAHVITLPQFIDRSFETYARAGKSGLICEPAEDIRFKTIGAPVDKAKENTRKLQEVVPPKPENNNPYRGLPDYHYWRRSVASLLPEELDPVVKPRFQIEMSDKIGTAGSCFAQHIAQRLQRSGYHYYVAEPAPDQMEAAEAVRLNYGVYSARYANVYTSRQLVQLFRRATNGGVDAAPWYRPDGRVVDPFRPEISPDGYPNEESMIESRREHLKAVGAVMKNSDVFVFTLGLTECWEDRNGIVTPIAPGIVASPRTDQGFRFKNLSATEVTQEMTEALELLRSVNPRVRVLLTVSPVPLIATFEDQHALTATTYSKSALRVAADELKRRFDFVDYFPSYEIITSQSNKGRYFDDDLRSIKPEGVSHVMRVFLKHYCGKSELEGLDAAQAAQEIVCEEELLDEQPKL